MQALTYLRDTPESNILVYYRGLAEADRTQLQKVRKQWPEISDSAAHTCCSNGDNPSAVAEGQNHQLMAGTDDLEFPGPSGFATGNRT